MTPGYRIDVDRPRSVLRMTLWGKLNDELIAAWGAERERAVRSLGAPPQGHLALYDITALELPTQDSFKKLARYIGDPSTMSRRAAVLTGSAIQRIQVRRMSTHPTVNFFTDRAEAEAWLEEDCPVANGARRRDDARGDA